MGVARYTENMENNQLSFEDIRPYLLYEFKNESQMLSSINEVGKFFNFYRENIDKYREDERLISAYCAYWLTTNYPKLFEILKLLPANFDINAYDNIVDVGTGPGTFLLALDSILESSPRVYGVDISNLMVEQARKLIEGLAAERKMNIGTKCPEGLTGKTLLIFTHSLNEMGASIAMDYLEKVSPDSVLVLEPGTKDAFGKTLELRELCVKADFNVAFPCYTNRPCPLDLEKDWCHQYLKTSHAQDVESMTQKLGRDRKLLPMTIQLYTKAQSESLTENSARLIRVYKQTKHSFEWMLCNEQDGLNHTFDVELPKRGMSKKEKKDIESWMAGEVVRYKVIKELENKQRIELI
ncbi:MAG: hypothetical protein CME64_00025 [Halobacteriovoraceae bacterium]|nr:hypothetical protein [Halobacteriovoraceae bacterium]